MASSLFILQTIVDDIKDNKPHKEIIADIKDLSVKNIIPEHEVIVIVSICIKCCCLRP
jgi:hypothetical protein